LRTQNATKSLPFGNFDSGGGEAMAATASHLWQRALTKPPINKKQHWKMGGDSGNGSSGGGGDDG
jgi:hypothetical protein